MEFVILNMRYSKCHLELFHQNNFLNTSQLQSQRLNRQKV